MLSTPDDAEWRTRRQPGNGRSFGRERTGDEGRAIREVNAVVARQGEASYWSFRQYSATTLVDTWS
jgi:hypothetical protein